MTNTATRVKTLTHKRGDAAVYRLNPPLDHGPLVVVSAVDLDSEAYYRSSETLVFPVDEYDNIDFLDIAMVPYKDHGDALQELGYEIVE